MHDLSISYLKRLERARDEAQALRDAMPKPPTLHERIEEWYNGLSDADKQRNWTMKEFRAIFGETPQKIGQALFDMNWIRKRMWKDNRPTSRYWFKV